MMDDPRSRAAVGQRLQTLRVAYGYTQEWLARYCGYNSYTTVTAWERGQNHIPPDAAAKLVHLFEVDYNYLYSGDDSQLEPHIRRRIRNVRPD